MRVLSAAAAYYIFLAPPESQPSFIALGPRATPELPPLPPGERLPGRESPPAPPAQSTLIIPPEGTQGLERLRKGLLLMGFAIRGVVSERAWRVWFAVVSGDARASHGGMPISLRTGVAMSTSG